MGDCLESADLRLRRSASSRDVPLEFPSFGRRGDLGDFDMMPRDARLEPLISVEGRQNRRSTNVLLLSQANRVTRANGLFSHARSALQIVERDKRLTSSP